ncbi:MAG: hypothetical protein GTN93_10420 [Anaerolineae bacterium]|nr:hypothetical protein [Anaerolineae bacterium]
MWFTRTADGIRGWFRLQTPSGVLRTGAVAGDFVATVLDPSDTTSSIVAVSESTTKAGIYFFDVSSTFLTTNGTGFYVVVVEVDTAGAPKVKATFSKVIKVDTLGFADIPSVTAIRAEIMTYVVDGNTLGLTTEETLDLMRKILNNRLELADGGVTPTANWVLYDDDDTTTLLTYDVTDKTGTNIIQPIDAPARRTRGV